MLLGNLVSISCHRNPPVYTFTQLAMDTVVEFTIVAKNAREAARVAHKAQKEIARIDSLFWEENSASPVYRWNHSVSGTPLPAEVVHLLQRAYHYYQISHGAFDITIKPVLDLYGFERENPRPPLPENLQEWLPFVGFSHIIFTRNGQVIKQNKEVQIALGGIAKGYAVDRAVRILRQGGISAAIVNAGGDLYCLGNLKGRAWRVGIQHPRKAEEILGVLLLSDKAVATSGDYQRFYIFQGKRYHHILNPFSGRPVRTCQSSTVIAPTTEMADALATAAFVLGPKQGIAFLDSLPDVEGMIVDSVGQLHFTAHFQDYLSKEIFSSRKNAENVFVP